ncbi:MAG: MFS transporter [Minwuia sp.]|uniref:MFS transporter n=1 Tax=Minwuia sp. TaxID=2493630 RepID=UPI003A8427F0
MVEIAASPAGAPDRVRERVGFFFLNIGHLFDHMFMLIFATAAIALVGMDGMTYGQLAELATPAFVAFGAFSLPAGWLAGKWSREGMLSVFFIGIGLSAIAMGFAESANQMMLALFLIGMFAAIYHPVGIAMVVHGKQKVGLALGINGVWGNMGIAVAPLATGILVELSGWRAAFIVPGIIAVLFGLAYILFVRNEARMPASAKKPVIDPDQSDLEWGVLIRVGVALILTILFGGIVFHTVSFALPKLFEERLIDVTTDLKSIGLITGAVFAIASFAQIVVGRLVDRYSPRTILLIVAFLQVPAFAIMATLTGLPAIFVGIVMMMVVFGEIPIHDTIVTRHTKSAWRSNVFAVKFVIALLVAAVVPKLIGTVHDAYGFETLFFILSAAAAGVVASALILPKARKIAPQKEATA